jgi:hypothetical protein
MLEKAAAEKEAIRLWRARPVQERLSYRQAVAFAKMIAPQLEFRTLGNRDRIIEGWLVRDILRTQKAVKVFDEKLGVAPRNPPMMKEPKPTEQPGAALLTITPKRRTGGAR